MPYGIHFIPSVGPEEKSAAVYYKECLLLAAQAETLGYDSIKIGEHYFFDYGGYSPDPVTFLAAAAVRTQRIRLVTGAVFPAFTHPLKLAAQLSMLDNLSEGRLDVGVARAFLPSEFDAFQIPLDESLQRFEEGIGAIRWLWTHEEATWEGRQFRFGPVRLLPRPYQQPHPPIWITATYTPELFEWAGRQGYHLMLVPYVSSHEAVANLLGIYRRAWSDAGHLPGAERVQLTVHCYVAKDGDHARREAQRYFEQHLSKLLTAVDAWSTRKTDQYPGYEHLVRAVRTITYDGALRATKILVGSPAEVHQQLGVLREWFGPFEPSLLVNFGNMPYERARRTLDLFARDVLPRSARTLLAG